jgi:hypothetical protein
MPHTPFDNIESAHEYVGLLAEAIDETAQDIGEQVEEAAREGAVRREEALRLVAFKLGKLAGHIGSSRRLLNDLRILRRLLLAERSAAQPVEAEAKRT